VADSNASVSHTTAVSRAVIEVSNYTADFNSVHVTNQC